MKKTLKILLITSSLFFLAGGLFSPLYAVFVERIGGTLETAGYAYGVFSIVAGIMIFFISRWEDRAKHQEKFIIIGYALATIGYLGYLFVSKTWHLYVVQAIFGLGEAIGTPAFKGIYSRNLDDGKFISQWGLWDSLTWIIIATAASIGGFIADTFGFKYLFFIMGAISLICFIVSLFLVSVDKKKNNKKK